MVKLEQIREQFNTLGVDGIIITNDQNRRYLTGFTGSAGVVLVSKTKAQLLVDFRYTQQASAQVTDYEVVLWNRDFEDLAKHVKDLGITKLGFEENHLTYAAHKKYDESIDAELVPTSGFIENFRMVKTASEIETIQAACAISDRAFEHILDFIRPGITELDVCNELEAFMRKLGAKSSAFDMIIASGYRGALPHGLASDKVIEKGDMVTLDFGAYYKDYRSDMTRTVAVGEPDSKLREIYGIVNDALSKGIEGLKPGLTTSDVDSLSRDYIHEKGYGDRFGHGLGHGVGLDIHEEPFFSQKTNTVVEEGMVVTIEPGIYIPDLGGVRIEDDVVVTNDGCKVLTHAPKDLIVL